MQTVTPVTAKLLEEAGFPKPEHPTFGQVFILGQSGKFFMFQEDTGMWEMLEVTRKYPERKLVEWNRVLAHRSVFAPTATDILEQLPGWNLAYTKVFGWIVYWDAPGLAEPIQFRHDNPAEAAAAAWFYKNKKK